MNKEKKNEMMKKDDEMIKMRKIIITKMTIDKLRKDKTNSGA